MDFFRFLGSPASVLHWASRKVFGVSLDERRDRELATADALRALRRQVEIVRETAGAVGPRLFGQGPEGATVPTPEPQAVGFPPMAASSSWLSAPADEAKTFVVDAAHRALPMKTTNLTAPE